MCAFAGISVLDPSGCGAQSLEENEVCNDDSEVTTLQDTVGPARACRANGFVQGKLDFQAGWPYIRSLLFGGNLGKTVCFVHSKTIYW